MKDLIIVGAGGFEGSRLYLPFSSISESTSSNEVSSITT